ncbi:carbon storage regulator CsrA [Hydrogenimonas thermophila]|uniref:Translational regulator CsrA n=1 Tax=Hydrogenimonas thermophila TaxID=223786 RepID=A0A1I5N254_9BACT|nr:carbon storage regulator CsrA [Hydrogenimonas thermophila]WOE70304.1 carbon storage regulator CsrA [Hydrogenimonas thermophila]WOE72821.1 carbon storage regulator CsrA [Hydrogenimonas thermophila]SFP15833.1 carbon storage regulator, CsrA [Hydrogenimonas thermophila]
MLVLTRKVDDAIRIGNDIVITIISIDKKNVRIGIDAPEDVMILREELVRAVAEENIKASGKAELGILNSLKEKLKKKP